MSEAFYNSMAATASKLITKFGAVGEIKRTTGDSMQYDDLAKLVLRRRGSMGIRAAANEIGISPTTLSRIERGHIPDRKTLDTICEWLGEKPAKFTGIGELQIAFKAKTAISPQTSQSLANLIELARDQFSNIEPEGHR